MANKKKNGPALFELIYRSKSKGADLLTVPEWMSGGKKPVKVPPARPSAAADEEPLVPADEAEIPPALQVEEEPPPPPPRKAEPLIPPLKPLPQTPPRAARPLRPGRLDKLRRKLAAAEGRRLRLSLTPTQAVASGVAAVLLIAGVFVLGLMARQPSSSPQAAEAGGAAPRAAAANPLPPPSTRTPLPPVASGTKHYLVVQGLMGMTEEHRAQAEAIAAFLNGRNEPVIVVEYKGTPRQYIVMSVRGFDDPDSRQAQDYVRAIEEQGKLYRSQGGRYEFKQGAKGWFIAADPAQIESIRSSRR